LTSLYLDSATLKWARLSPKPELDSTQWHRTLLRHIRQCSKHDAERRKLHSHAGASLPLS